MDLFNQLGNILRPEPQNNHLDSFKQAAISAHNWTSFSPERRGEQLINDYNDQLSEDIADGCEVNVFYLSAHTPCTIRLSTKKEIKLNTGEFYHLKEGEQITHRKFTGFDKFTKV